MNDITRDFLAEITITGYYFKDLMTQRTSACCSMHFEYVKSIINPKTNRWKITRVCSGCGNIESTE